ncbi:MAG: hypothetical protein ACLVJ6_17555 [Merdibacter sp.]
MKAKTTECIYDKKNIRFTAAFFGEAIVLAADTTRHGNNENPYLYKLDPVSHEDCCGR